MTDILLRVDALIAEQGSASPADAGVDAQALIDLARSRPDLEPVFLMRFRSPSGKVRIEWIRAYGWPSRRIALRHLGYRAEEARLLALEPRQAVPFPERFYAAFDNDPARLEELRLAQLAYEEAMRRASSSPGRTERELVRLARAFRKLGETVEIDMWIDAATVLSDLGHPVFAAKMLDHLRSIVEKEMAIDLSLLARTVLGAADAGVFHGKLYEIVRGRVAAIHSPQAAVGFGLRVLRRLLRSGRALPVDFVKDLRQAAEQGSIEDFDTLLDATIAWAAGLASFWNALKKRPGGGHQGRAVDPPDMAVLRRRLAELLKNASPEGKAALWAAIGAVGPELSAYGRVAVVEMLLVHPPDSRNDAEHLLEATLALLGRVPREADRERVESAAERALEELIGRYPDLLRERFDSFDGALRNATIDLPSLVVFSDLFAAVADRIGLPGALSGLPAVWATAVATALAAQPSNEAARAPAGLPGGEPPEAGLSRMPLLAILAEALGLVSPDGAAEPLAALGAPLAARLAGDLAGGVGLCAWERVLHALGRLGPVGSFVTATATARFLTLAGSTAALGHAASIAHLLDVALLKDAAHSPATPAPGQTSALQAARAAVLESLRKDPPPPKRVPPRAAGLTRAELCRAVRSAFHDPLASLVFWSLDGDTPAPLLEHFMPSDKPASERSAGMVMKLVGLAQRVRFSRTLAARALRLAGSLCESLALRPAASGGPEDIGALEQGIELTRKHLDHREALRPDAWPVPAIGAVESLRHRRFVLLAWLLGRLDTSDVGSHHLVFERIAAATPLVRSGYGRLLPARGGQGEMAFSAAFLKLRQGSLVRVPIHGDGPLEDVIVLCDPRELAGAFMAEAGL